MRKDVTLTGLILTLLGLLLPMMGHPLPSLLTIIFQEYPGIGRITVNGYVIDGGTPSAPVYIGYRNPSEIRVEWDVSPGEGGSLTVTVDSSSVQMSWQGYGVWGGSSSLQKGIQYTLTARGTVGGTAFAKSAVFVLVDDAPVIEAYFNGRLVKPTDTVTVSNPNISFSLKVTNSYYVKRFEFWLRRKGELAELKYWSESPGKVGPVSSQTYSYTLPGPGTYELTGYVVGQDDRRTQGLSLLGDYGAWSIKGLINILTVPGFALTVAGLVLPGGRRHG